jgi:hypothetical protein
MSWWKSRVAPTGYSGSGTFVPLAIWLRQASLRRGRKRCATGVSPVTSHGQSLP